jgi:putative CocE/NonD family hydrolase
MGGTQFSLAGAGPEGIAGQHIAVATMHLYQYGYFQNGVFRGPDPPPAWLLQHPHYDDFWRDLELGPRLEQARWPIVHEGGWFDGALQSTIDAFSQLQETGGEGARGRQHLVIGPWTHGFGFYARQQGELTFPANATFPPGAPDLVQWLGFWLKGEHTLAADEPAVRYYVMGDVTDRQAPGNTWRTASGWPPSSRPLRLYFAADGGLEPQAPATPAALEYDYDPTKPVPTLRGDWDGPVDQRPVEARPDVLVFTTPPLAEPLEVTGRIGVRLYAATSARDTDFTAKLTDVYPNGRSMLVTDGIVRARHRRTLEKDELVTPEERTAYDIDLWSTSLIFNRGHRIRVAISSSNAPRFEPNTNTGEPWPFTEKPVVAHQTVFLGGAEASHILLPDATGGGNP